MGNRQSGRQVRGQTRRQAARGAFRVGNRQCCGRRFPSESGPWVGNRQSRRTDRVNNQTQSVEKLCISCLSAVYYTPCDCRLPTRRCLLHTEDCLLPTKRCLLPTGPSRKSLSAFSFLALFGPKTLKPIKTYLKPVCVPQPTASRLRLPAPPGAYGALRPRPLAAAFPTRHRISGGFAAELQMVACDGCTPPDRLAMRRPSLFSKKGEPPPSNIAVKPPQGPLGPRSRPG